MKKGAKEKVSNFDLINRDAFLSICDFVAKLAQRFR